MDSQKNNNQIITEKGCDVMDSQNNNQIIAEKGPLDKIEADKDFFNRLKIDELNRNLTSLQVDLYNMKFDLQVALKRYENRISDIDNISGNIKDNLWKAKCNLSNQISECEITVNHHSLKLERLEDKLENQKTYQILTENELKYQIKHLYELVYMLCGAAIAAAGGLFLVSLLQIFHR